MQTRNKRHVCKCCGADTCITGTRDGWGICPDCLGIAYDTGTFPPEKYKEAANEPGYTQKP